MHNTLGVFGTKVSIAFCTLSMIFSSQPQELIPQLSQRNFLDLSDWTLLEQSDSVRVLNPMLKEFIDVEEKLLTDDEFFDVNEEEDESNDVFVDA